MVAKKPAKKTTKKVAKKPAAKKATGKPKALAAVPDLPPDVEVTKVEDKPKPTKPPAKKVGAPRPVGRPAIPSISTPKFSPDSSLLKPVTEDDEEFLRITLYGDPGVGKTTSLASLTERGVVVIMDPENSVRRRALARQGVNVDNLRIWEDGSYEGMQQLYVTIKDELEKDPKSIYAVGIDSASTLGRDWLEDSVIESIARPEMKKKHPNRQSYETFQEDYGTLADKFRSVIIRMFFTLPCHVVLTAHSRRSTNELDQIVVGPDLTPAVMQPVFTHSDWVLQLSIDKLGDRRKLITSPRGQITAKDRFGVLDQEIFNNSLMNLVEVWEEDQ